MFFSVCWLVGTVMLIIFTSELASEVTESNLGYTKSKWLGAHSSAGEMSVGASPDPLRNSDLTATREYQRL